MRKFQNHLMKTKVNYGPPSQHFLESRLLKYLNELVYRFHFLTPTDYDKFFQFLREGNLDFVSELDAVLDGNENGSDL